MEGLEFHSHSLRFISKAAVLPLFSLLSQLRPVLLSSSCCSSRISNQKSSGKDTGGGVCCAIRVPGQIFIVNMNYLVWDEQTVPSPEPASHCARLWKHTVGWKFLLRKSATSSCFWWNFLHKTLHLISCFFSSNLPSLCFWQFGITARLRFVIPTAPFPKEPELQNNYGSWRKKICKALCLSFFYFSDLQDLKEKEKTQTRSKEPLCPFL